MTIVNQNKYEYDKFVKSQPLDEEGYFDLQKSCKPWRTEEEVQRMIIIIHIRLREYNTHEIVVFILFHEFA